VEIPQLNRSVAVRFADDDAASLLADRLGELCEPAAHGWSQVKHNASRTVYRRTLDGQEVYLKHFHPRSPVRRLLRRLGVSDARWEMTVSRYLAERGVPTPEPLAAAWGDGVEWLATRAVAPSQPADQWHAEQLAAGAAGRRRVQRALVRTARMVGRMHAAGVIHDDLHCGNILVRTDGEPRVVLMDHHRVRRKRLLRRRHRAANLAQLFHDRYETTTRTERLRFLKHYLASTDAAGTLRGWQVLVEQFARRHRSRQFAARDRRVHRRNRYFADVRLPRGWRGSVVLASKRKMAGSRAAELEFTREQWLDALREPETLLDGEDVTVVKDSRSGKVVRRRLRVGGREVDVYVKRPRRKRAYKFLLDCFRPARPSRAFRLGHALLTRRIATCLPLAALERRVGPFLLDSVLITEAVDAPMLNRFLSTWLGSPPRGDVQLSAVEQRQLAQEVLAELGRVVQRLHDSRFAHRDLKASNMLVRWEPPGACEVVLIDLDGLIERRRLSTRWRFQGLMRLNVSLLQCPEVNHAGRLRMLLGYLRRPGCGRIHFKPYWRVLEQWSAKKLRQQIRSRRRRQKAVRRPGG